MDQPIARDFASNASSTSLHVRVSENAPPGRYTCYDTATFLALYIILATTSTVDAAGEAFEESENRLKAHKEIEITDAHAALARLPSLKVTCRAEEEQAGEKGKERMGSRFFGKMKKAVQNLKGE